jgi:hypothetical protein
MILRWSPFKIVFVSTVLYPRWPPLLKIEISSNVDLDMLNMFAVSTYHLSLIVFEIKDEKYSNFENLMKKGQQLQDG